MHVNPIKTVISTCAYKNITTAQDPLHHYIHLIKS